jgi:hypothetical protein
MDIKSNLLITSTLDEKWTEVYISIINYDIFVYRVGVDYLSSPKNNYKNINSEIKKINLHTIHNNFITNIVKDLENLAIRIDYHPSNYSISGYFSFKFNIVSDYNTFIKTIENSIHFKNIIWSNRT